MVEKAIVKGIFSKYVVLTLRDEDYECRDVIVAGSTNQALFAEFVGIVAYQHACCGARSFVPEDCWGSLIPDSFIPG